MRIYVHDEHSRALRITPDTLEPLVTEVVWFDYSAISSPHRDREHLHHYHQIDVILDGEFTLMLNGDTPVLGRPGDGWIVPPLIWHGVNCQSPFRYCSFKFHLAPRFWKRYGTAFQRFHVPQYLIDCVDAVGKRSSSFPPLVSQHAAAVISLCLIELSEQHSLDAIEDEELNEFRHSLWPLLESIQREPNIKWSVARMAEALNLSPDYFSRCFHRTIGQTPQQYVLETTMRESAAKLIKIPASPIKEIAQCAGYANVQAFTHAFTNVFKISPAAYRRQCESGSVDGQYFASPRPTEKPTTKIAPQRKSVTNNRQKARA